jgi:hypothetical protein
MLEYFVFTYEHWKIKPVEIVLKRGQGEISKKDGGDESN